MELGEARANAGARVWWGPHEDGTATEVEIRSVSGELVTVCPVADLVGEMAPADRCKRVCPLDLHFEESDARLEPPASED